MKFLEEIKEEVQRALYAENNAAEWKKEAAMHYGTAKKLIVAAKISDPESADVDAKTLIEQVKAELTAPVTESKEIPFTEPNEAIINHA